MAKMVDAGDRFINLDRVEWVTKDGAGVMFSGREATTKLDAGSARALLASVKKDMAGRTKAPPAASLPRG